MKERANLKISQWRLSNLSNINEKEGTKNDDGTL